MMEKYLNFLFIGMPSHKVEIGEGHKDKKRIEKRRKIGIRGLCFIKWPKRWLHWHAKQEGLRRYMLEGWTSCQNCKVWKPRKIED